MNGHHPGASDRFGGQNPAYDPLQHTSCSAREEGLKESDSFSLCENMVKGDRSALHPVYEAVIGGGMFVLSNFLVAVAKILDIGLSLYMWIIIGRAVISWVNPDPYNPIVRFLNSVTEPVLYPIRRRLPLHFGGIDFSPIIVILGIIFAQSFLVQTLYQFAARMSG